MHHHFQVTKPKYKVVESESQTFMWRISVQSFKLSLAFWIFTYILNFWSSISFTTATTCSRYASHRWFASSTSAVNSWILLSWSYYSKSNNKIRSRIECLRVLGTENYFELQWIQEIFLELTCRSCMNHRFRAYKERPPYHHSSHAQLIDVQASL